MSRSMFRTIIPVGALVALPLVAAPAMARQDPGSSAGPPVSTTMPGGCRLERVGSQLVRCDLLTGNGVPAPRYIPER